MTRGGTLTYVRTGGFVPGRDELAFFGAFVLAVRPGAGRLATTSSRGGASVCVFPALRCPVAVPLRERRHVAGVLGAKRVNAHPYALVGAALGTLVGLFGGIVGLLFMPFVGAGLGEWIGRQDTRKDLGRITQVGLATWLGMLIGTVVKLALGFLMVGLFVLALVV